MMYIYNPEYMMYISCCKAICCICTSIYNIIYDVYISIYVICHMSYMFHGINKILPGCQPAQTATSVGSEHQHMRYHPTRANTCSLCEHLKTLNWIPLDCMFSIIGLKSCGQLPNYKTRESWEEKLGCPVLVQLVGS